MTTRSVVCPECDSPVAPGRYSCPSCGTVLAAVAGLVHPAGSRPLDPASDPAAEPGPRPAPALRPRRQPAPATAVRSRSGRGRRAAPSIQASVPLPPPEPVPADAAARLADQALAADPPPVAPEWPAAPAWPASRTWPPAPAAEPVRPAAEPIRSAAPAPVATASRTPAGAYLPPSAILPPGEALPQAGAAPAAAPIPPVAGPAAADRGRLALDLAPEAGARAVAAGTGIAGLGFLLPWADVVIGSGQFGGYTARWGLAGPAHLAVVGLLLGLWALALFAERLPRWARPGLPSVAVGGLLAGLLWPYLFGPLEASFGVYVVAIGALVTVGGGLLDLHAPRHAAPAAGV